MDNQVLQKLLLESVQGNFKSVNSLIISEKLDLDDRAAAKIITSCCRIFTKNDVSVTVEVEHLYELLTTCLQFINSLDDSNVLNYFQSLFFILKFFLQKKKFRLVLQMENILIPKFMESLKTTKLADTYKALTNLIHTTIADLQHTETSDKRNHMFCHLCILSLKMKFMQLSSSRSLANTACSYFKTLKFIEADTNVQFDCYLSVLHLIKSSKTKDLDDTFSTVIIISEVVVKNLFKQNEFNKIRTYINTITSEIRKLFNTKMYQKLFNILCCVSQFIVKLEDNQESSEKLTNNFEICFTSLKYFSAKYGYTSELRRMCNLFIIIFSNLVEYYGNINPTVWNTYMMEETQIKLFQLLGGIGQIVSLTEIKCDFCSNCKVKTGIYAAANVTMLVGNLLKISLSTQINISKSLAAQALCYLECCCTFIRKLENQECSEWKSAWTQVGIGIYNIAVKLYVLQHSDCCDYFNLLIKNLIDLEGITESFVFKFDVLSTSLQCLSQIHIDRRQYKAALMFAAIEIAMCPKSVKGFNQWIQAKAKSKESNIMDDALQHLTVICVLQQNENEIRKLCSNVKFDLSAPFTVNVLLDELEKYKSLWPSKIPMMGVFKKLFETADLLTLVKTLIQTWGENLGSAHNNVLKLLHEIIIKFEVETKVAKGDQKVENQIYLASLYAMQYYSDTKKARQKIADDIDNTVTSEQFPLPSHEIPKNPNDECDLVSSYVSLKLDEHLKTISFLSKALSLFNFCVSKSISLHIVEVLKRYNIFKLVMKIAYEFRLHCNSLQAIQSWFICLKISKLLNNSLHILTSISFLLEETNMKSEVIQKLLIEAKNLENELSVLPSCEVWETLTTYHISKSTMLLRQQNIELGFGEYQKAVQCFTNIAQENIDEIVKIRLNFLHVQFLRLPCNLQIEGHNVYLLAKFSQVFYGITQYINVSGNHSSFALAILFEVNQSVAHMYRWMFLPREVRCYCRNIVTLAQKLVIPLQTAYFLLYLAHADLHSVRLNDCQVKLNGLSDILCLDNKKTTSLQNEVNIQQAVVKPDKDISNLVENFTEIMLDCPSPERKYQGSLASPVLFTEPFKLPSFMKHSVDCDCFYCVSVEYKDLVLQYINLEAQLNIHLGNMVAAHTCFNGALQFYKNISKGSSTFKMKVTTLLSCYPLYDINNTLCQTFCTLLLDYGNNFLRTNNIKKAQYFNQKLLSLISERKYENMYLYNEAFIQNLVIITTMCDKTDISKQSYLEINSESFIGKDNNEAPKTPENNCTKIVFPTCYSPRPNSPPKRPVRRIKCDFSDTKSETDDHLTKLEKPSFAIHVSPAEQPAGNIKFSLSDEMQNTEKNKNCTKSFSETPSAALCTATAGIPTIIKTVKKRKPILQEISLPASNIKASIKSTNRNCSSAQDNSMVVPLSPNAYTPNALKVSVLQSRTKLLTKKLKKSTVKDISKNPSDIVNEENIVNANTRTDHTNNVRKNLMNELCDTENYKGQKRVYKKKTEKQNLPAETDKVVTRRTTRTSTKIINKK